jgi:hypothetical protein
MLDGYSKKSLVEKLGIKPGFRMFIIHEPTTYWKELGKLPEGSVVSKRLSSQFNFIHYFSTEQSELKKVFPSLKEKLTFQGILWISWPKKVAQTQTDLNENSVREIGLKNGLVDVKVCAVDEVWSGLKFVYRLKDRK